MQSFAEAIEELFSADFSLLEYALKRTSVQFAMQRDRRHDNAVGQPALHFDVAAALAFNGETHNG